jgi:proline dehydrogenase
MSTTVHPATDRLPDFGQRYVAGLDRESALSKISELHAGGVACNIGRLVPVAPDEATAEATTAGYLSLARDLAGVAETTWLEVDLPQVGLDVSAGCCVRQLGRIAEQLPAGRWIQVGAEDSGRTDAVVEVVLAARRRGVPIRATIQANLRRSPADVARLVAAGMPLRLVKGGFAEPRQLAWAFGEPTNLAFLGLARQILRAGTGLTLATHDRLLQQALLPEAGDTAVEMLLGVRPEVVDELLGQGRQVRLFVPYGTDWSAYVAKRVEDAAKAERDAG